MDQNQRGSGDFEGDAGKRPTPAPPAPSSASTAGLAGLGLQFVIAILLCLFVGKWLDTRLGTTPWLLILGVFCGAGVSMVAMYRRVFPSEKSKSTPSQGNRP
jgi:F0F1-type ATP synthase assembly protein I